MKHLAIALILAAFAVPSARAQDEEPERQKLARTTMKFLNISADPRAAALGDAVTAFEHESTALFYNPAGMARQEHFLSVSAAQTQWFVDVKYNFASLALRPLDGRLGVFAFSFVSADYGDIEETIRSNNEDGFLDLGTFSPAALSFGIGYARALSDRFSVGGHVKYVSQDLGSSVMRTTDSGYERRGNKESVVAFDFGMLYHTGFRSLTFAAGARNFAREIEYAEESFELPLLLKIGVKMDMLDLFARGADAHSFVLALDTESPRDYREQIKVGGEYTFLNTFSLRAGYVFPTDVQGIHAGVGVDTSVGGISLGADYAYSDYGVFSDVHRIGLRVSL